MEKTEFSATAEQINKTIGVRMAALMQSRSFAPADMATTLATSSNRIGRMQRGTTEMTAAELVLAAKALGVTSAILTGEATYKEPAA